MKRTILFILTIVTSLTVALPAYASSKYSYYYQRAEEYYQKEDYNQALRYLQMGVEANPKDAYCWAVIAEIYSKYAYARYAEAMDATVQALRYIGKDRYWKGFIYGIRGDIYYKTDNMQESKIAYQQAMTINPDNHTSIAMLADVCQELGEYDESIALYRKLISMDSSEPYWYSNIGNVCIKAKLYDEARQNLRMSIALLSDNNKQAYANMGLLALAESNNTIEAAYWAKQSFLHSGWCKSTQALMDTLVKKDFHAIETAALQLLEHLPNDVNHLSLLYYLYNENDKPVDAAYYVQNALTIEDDNSYHITLARLYACMDMYQEAINEYQTVLSNDTSLHSLVYYELSQLSMLHADYEQAHTYIDKCIRLDNEDAHLLRFKAKIYQIQGRHQEATSMLETALAHSEEDERRVFYLNLGEEYMELGQIEQGRSYLNMCLEMGADKRTYHVTLALAAACLGDTALTREHIQVIEQNTQKDEYEDLAMVYAALGDTDAVYANLRHITGTVQLGQGSMMFNQYRYRSLHGQPGFLTIVAEQDSVMRKERERLNAMQQAQDSMSGVTEIPFTIHGGVNQVRCLINGLPLYFVFDTGASDVTISSVEANFMLKNGYLTDTDFMGKQNYVTATGEIHEGTVINLREVRVGDITLTNIKASVVSSQSAPLLLGQTVFRRFGTMEVDNTRKVIIFRK